MTMKPKALDHIEATTVRAQTIVVRVSDEERAAMLAVARREGRTLSGLIRHRILGGDATCDA